MFLTEEGIAIATNRTMRNLGISEKKPVFTFDGNPEGKEISDVGVRVGDIIDLHSIQKITGFLNGEKIVVTSAEITVETIFEGLTAAMYNGTPVVSILQVDGTPAGTYVLFVDEQTYVDYVELTETIHPIDPKYLFPRVELKTKLRVEDLPAKYEFYPVTAEDQAALEEAFRYGIFYVSAHVADIDNNPWHLGGIPTLRVYEGGTAEETNHCYEVLSTFEEMYISLQLTRYPDGTWHVACMTGYHSGVQDGNTGNNFPTLEA